MCATAEVRHRLRAYNSYADVQQIPKSKLNEVENLTGNDSDANMRSNPLRKI